MAHKPSRLEAAYFQHRVIHSRMEQAARAFQNGLYDVAPYLASNPPVDMRPTNTSDLVTLQLHKGEFKKRVMCPDTLRKLRLDTLRGLEHGSLMPWAVAEAIEHCTPDMRQRVFDTKKQAAVKCIEEVWLTHATLQRIDPSDASTLSVSGFVSASASAPLCDATS